MEAQEFAGKDGFIWFTGIVEGREDPAMIGRVRVRIIGWHDDNKNIVPTESLPWAQVLMPVTGQRSFSIPKEGEWVMGFFQDGANGQMPVIMGIYPGIVPNKSTTYLNQKGFGIEFDAEQKKNQPSPPAGVNGDEPGKPTTPALGREQVAGTIVGKQNNDLVAVCDFISEMQKNMKLREYMVSVGQAIRDGIRRILSALGLTDATGKGTWAISVLKSIKKALDWFNKNILKPIQDFQKYVLAYIVKMRQIIQWILSLPEKFLALLQDCLSKTLKLIGQIFTDTIGGIQEGVNLNAEGEFTTLIAEAQSVADSAREVLTNTLNVTTNAIAIPVAATAGLFEPVSQSDVDAANSYIAEYEKSSDNEVPSPIKNATAP